MATDQTSPNGAEIDIHLSEKLHGHSRARRINDMHHARNVDIHTPLGEKDSPPLPKRSQYGPTNRGRIDVTVSQRKVDATLRHPKLEIDGSANRTFSITPDELPSQNPFSNTLKSAAALSVGTTVGIISGNIGLGVLAAETTRTIGGRSLS